MEYEPITNPHPWPLKDKYLVGFTAARHSYRTRTGPNCCNANCARRKGKRRKKQYVAVRPGQAGVLK